jgi:hypothetical protein
VPSKPVSEATPGYQPAKGAAMGGAIQMIQAKQFSSLQGAEVAKYEKRLAQLQPKIDAYLANGYTVELLLIVEKPDRVDVMCVAGVFCDASQFIYYRDLYISRITKPIPRTAPREPVPYATMSSAGESHQPYPSQGGSIREEWEIKHLTPLYRNHHTEYAKQSLSPPLSLAPYRPSERPAQPKPPKPQLDPATKQALALFPSRVYLLSGNIVQYKTAHALVDQIKGNTSFVVMKEDIAALGRTRTIVSYYSDLDKARAEALAEIVRAAGPPDARAELSGKGDDAPGVLQINFGRDAEK